MITPPTTMTGISVQVRDWSSCPPFAPNAAAASAAPRTTLAAEEAYRVAAARVLVDVARDVVAGLVQLALRVVAVDLAVLCAVADDGLVATLCKRAAGNGQQGEHGYGDHDVRKSSHRRSGGCRLDAGR